MQGVGNSMGKKSIDFNIKFKEEESSEYCSYVTCASPDRPPLWSNTF